MTIRIAKLELIKLFSAPLSWILLVGFSIYGATIVYPIIDQQTFQQALYNADHWGLTNRIFTGTRLTLFSVTSTVFMFLIPIIGMGVISREESTGTIKLLYSSPVKMRSLVLGKYLALQTFVSILVFIVLIFVIIGALTIQNFESTTMVASMITFFLYSAMISALVLLVSTFSSYPVIDAVAAIAILYGLKIIYGLVSNVPVINEIFYWLVPEVQLETAFTGLMTSRNIGYFLLLITLFLLLTYWRMVLKRQTMEGKRIVRLKMLGAVLACAGGIYFLTFPQFFIYKDLSPGEVNLLKPKSREILAPLKNHPITITTYSNIFGTGRNGVSYGRQIFNESNRFGKYVLEFPQIDFQYKFFYSQAKIDQLLSFTTIPGVTKDTPIKEALAIQSKKSDVPLEDIKTLKEHGLNESIVDSYVLEDPVVVISVGDKQVPISMMYNDGSREPSENEITTAFARLIGMEAPVGYVTGHGERSYTNAIVPSGLSKMISALPERMAYINQGMPTTAVKLSQPIDESIEVLVIANPTAGFSEEEIKNFSNYLTGGGDALILSEPNQEAIVNPLLALIGMSQKASELQNEDPNLEKHYVFPTLAGPLSNEEESFVSPLIFTPRVAALELVQDKGFTYVPTATYEDEVVIYTAERMVNGKQQRIIVAGDTDMLSDANALPRAPGGNNVANGLMGSRIASFLTDGVLPLGITRFSGAEDIRTTIAFEHLNYLWVFMYLLFPGMFLVAGVMTIIRRSKR